jgi:hypothetical protein
LPATGTTYVPFSISVETMPRQKPYWRYAATRSELTILSTVDVSDGTIMFP